jgi:hypothetical protein
MKKLIAGLVAASALALVPAANAQTTTAWLDCKRTEAEVPFPKASQILPPQMVGTAIVNCALGGNAPDYRRMEVQVRLDKLCLMRRRTTGASRPWVQKNRCNGSAGKWMDMRYVKPLGIFFKAFEIERSVLRANVAWSWQTTIKYTVKATYRGRTQASTGFTVSSIANYKYK